VSVTLDIRVEHLLRDLSPQVLAAVARRFGDFAAAEDAVQESLIAAATQWPREGLPQNPRGWLIQVAARRMTDQIRADSARRKREAIVTGPEPLDARFAQAGDADSADRDDTLLLLFMCCHPSLSPSSAIALTLRAVGGLTTAEIGRAFLVPESTMAQRISRAKQTVRSSGVRFEPPSAGELAPRLASVLHVLYLMFNEGYAASSGPELGRPDLANEAIRLAREVHRWLPDETEAAGLLALMLLTDARRAARTTSDGELIPLDQQDRSLWNRRAIDEGVALISATLPKGSVGPYRLQAAIAAVHDEAATAGETDWAQIVALYTVLARISDNPMVTLNRAIAVAMVSGATAGLALLDRLQADDRMRGHYRLDAVRGHLLEQAGDRDGAIRHYLAAAARTASVPERNYLATRAARLATPATE
jgi:RNA polymerase sigma factor (sigma-70 family)